ncbi:MAG TPA: AMP-binding protein [Ilumatobacteraceae bacterium]|nr:AMP-binding protein [Ilumatobacteraceae bacterium]
MPLSYASGPSVEPLLGETIGDNFDRVAVAHADQLCLISRHEGIRLTYAEMASAVDRCARGLLATGIHRGDRIGIWAPNRSEWAILQYAAAKVGAILVNINPAYRTHEVAYVLEQSGCRMLVATAEFKGSNYVTMIAEVRRTLRGLETTVFLDSSAGDMSWAALLAAADAVTADQLEARQSVLQFDDPINIQYTSGTTGFPKGATLSHHNILNNAYNVTGLQGLGPGDPLCIPVPLYHCFGMVMGNLGCTTRGAAIVYPAPSFEPDATLAAVEAERCVSLYGVPTMFIAMLDSPRFAEFDLTSLRTGVMAGSPCPVEVMKRCVNDMHMSEVTICYGMTETSPVSFQSRTDDSVERRVSTVGRVHPWVECKIVEPNDGAVVQVGETGELCTRGYSVMLGYWDNPGATTAAIDEAGWMHTGDLAVMDEEGFVNIVGRSKDMIIRGGENVYPREIEEFLYTHPAIVDVQVIGVPDKRFGEEICAWVRLRDGDSLTIDELRAFCEGRIAHYKVPRYMRVSDQFPMTVTGKVRKVEMREISASELGLVADVTA